MHDCDWLGKFFTLSLIGYTSTRERAVRHSDWLYRLFSRVKIKRIDFYKWALSNKILVLCAIKLFMAHIRRDSSNFRMKNGRRMEICEMSPYFEALNPVCNARFTWRIKMHGGDQCVVINMSISRISLRLIIFRAFIRRRWKLVKAWKAYFLVIRSTVF